MAFRTRFTAHVRAKVLEHLAAGWSVTASAVAAGISRQTVYDQRAADPMFHAAFEDAIERGTDTLEDEARRRALAGVEKPVYQRGVLVGHVQEYSDGLLTLLLKARRPETYRERHDIRQGLQGDMTVRVEYVNTPTLVELDG